MRRAFLVLMVSLAAAGCGGGSGGSDKGDAGGGLDGADAAVTGDAAGDDGRADQDGAGADAGDSARPRPTGFTLLDDVNPRRAGVTPHEFVEVNGKLLFRGATSALGYELYVTDGTAAGTSLLKDIDPNGSSLPELEEGALLGGVLYFSATDALGKELWRTDGTAAGTTRVADLRPGPEGAFPGKIRVMGGSLYFFATDSGDVRRLWLSDGSAAGTVAVAASGGSQPVVLGNRLIFDGYDDTSGREPWVSDGTAAGTMRLADVQPGTQGSSPDEFFVAGGLVYFWANDGTTGYEPWRTDGTPGGTRRLKDIGPGSAGGTYIPDPFGALGDTVFFRASDGTNGEELWKTDGTEAGTVMVLDGTPGRDGSYPGYFKAAGGLLYFSTQTGAWRTDGTPAGTIPLGGGTRVYAFESLGAQVLFSGYSEAEGQELWRTDGTAAGTARIVDRNPGPANSYPNELHPFAGKVMFSCNDGQSDGALCITDGTAAGTNVLTDLSGGRTSSSQPFLPRSPGVALRPGGLFFLADDGVTGPELYLTDGTAAGTKRLTDNWPGPRGGVENSGYAPPPVTTPSGRCFLFMTDPAHGRELWTSDGTAAGTRLVKDVAPGPTGSNESESYGAPIVPVGEVVYFGADDGVHGGELWRSDGTEAGTQMVVDLAPGPGDGIRISTSSPQAAVFRGAIFVIGEDGTDTGSAVFRIAGGTATRVSPNGPETSELAVAGDWLYFTSSSELWRSDGTPAGTTRVADIKDITAGPETSANIFRMTAVGGLLAFIGDDGVSGEELWRSDGTAAGTFRVKDFNPGAGDGLPATGLGAVLDGRLFFAAGDGGSGGEELWSSDLSAADAGTRRVLDLNPGAGSSYPGSFVVYRGNLYFGADDGTHGVEVYRTDGTAAGTAIIADLNPGSAHGGVPAIVFDDALVVIGDDGVHGSEPWLYRAP